MQRKRLIAFASLLVTLSGCKMEPAPPTEADVDRFGQTSILALGWTLCSSW
jgi:hypothetical protein